MSKKPKNDPQDNATESSVDETTSTAPESATSPVAEPPFPPLHGQESAEAADTEARVEETAQRGFDPVGRDVEGAAADASQPDATAPSVVQNDPETAIDPQNRSHDELARLGQSDVPHAQLPVALRDADPAPAAYDVHAHVRHVEAGTDDAQPGHGLPTELGRQAVLGTDERIVGAPVKVIDPLTESHGLDNGSLPVHRDSYAGEIPKGSSAPNQAAPSDRQSGTSRFPTRAIGSDSTDLTN